MIRISNFATPRVVLLLLFASALAEKSPLVRSLIARDLTQILEDKTLEDASLDGSGSAEGLQSIDAGSDREGRAGILTSIDFDEDIGDASDDGGTGASHKARATGGLCGIRRSAVPDIFTRIVGGSVAEKHEFPWQVSLQWRYSWYSYHVCGATALSHSWVVTAAHCTHQFKATDLIVIGGVHNIKHRESSEQKREIERVVEHWGYNPNTQENDIALIKLRTPFVIDGLTMSPVCLPPTDFAFKDNCVVSGWGKTTENGRSSDELRKVVVPIISRKQCRENYRVVGYTGPISEKMICAGYNQGVKDACQGDSGGPFVCRGRDNRYLLAGIVSWGVGCARPNVPGVYTQVSRFIPWIASVVHRRDIVTERAVSQQTSLHLDDIADMSDDVTTPTSSNGHLEDFNTFRSELPEQSSETHVEEKGKGDEEEMVTEDQQVAEGDKMEEEELVDLPAFPPPRHPQQQEYEEGSTTAEYDQEEDTEGDGEEEGMREGKQLSEEDDVISGGVHDPDYPLLPAVYRYE